MTRRIGGGRHGYSDGSAKNDAARPVKLLADQASLAESPLGDDWGPLAA